MVLFPSTGLGGGWAVVCDTLDVFQAVLIHSEETSLIGKGPALDLTTYSRASAETVRLTILCGRASGLGLLTCQPMVWTTAVKV
jgi:hypothetical protein